MKFCCFIWAVGNKFKYFHIETSVNGGGRFITPEVLMFQRASFDNKKTINSRLCENRSRELKLAYLKSISSTRYAANRIKNSPGFRIGKYPQAGLLADCFH